MRDGLRPMTRSSHAMNGFSMPASVMIPKKRIANTNMQITPEIPSIPASMNFPVFSPNPAASDASTGKRIRATIGDTFLLRIAAITATITSAPRIARDIV